MEFVEPSVFAKRIDALLSQDEQWFLQAALLARARRPDEGSIKLLKKVVEEELK